MLLRFVLNTSNCSYDKRVTSRLVSSWRLEKMCLGSELECVFRMIFLSAPVHLLWSHNGPESRIILVSSTFGGRGPVKGTGAIRTDAMVIDPVTGGELWRFTGFYGESRRELRYRSWDLLKYLNTQSASPWLCAGDFNEILDASEQFGGLTRSERQMDGFWDAVDTCGFSDLGFIGLPYTWDNQQQGDSNIKVRLDRAFANSFFF